MKQWQQFLGIFSSSKFLILVIVYTLTIGLSSCQVASHSNNTQNPNSPANPSTVLVYGSGGQPVNLESGNVVDGNSLTVQEQIYDHLIRFKPGTTEIEPSLATSWDGSADSKVWTFKLRQGVKFQDGSNFDAAAVKFNVDRWWDATDQYGYRNAGKTYEIWPELFGGYKGDKKSLVKDVIVVDQYTIQFVLNQSFAVFPMVIGSGNFGIASPTAIKQAGANYGTGNSLAVGTGPFIFKEWRTGDRIILEKNPNYWQKVNSPIQQLIIRFITDPAARLAQLRANQIDLTVDLAPDQMSEIQSDRNLEALARPSLNVGYLSLNPSYKPLTNIKIRQAIAMAINKKEIVKAFWGKLGISDSHFTPPSLAWSQSPKLTDYEYNPQQAKQLLTEAGYPNGFDLDLWYMPVSRPYFPTPKPIAEAFAADLSNIGIRVKLKTKDWAAYLSDRQKSPGYQSFMLGWTADYGDPDNFYYAHFGPGSTQDLGDWKNDQVIQLLQQGRATVDPAIRAKIYSEIDEILFKELVRIPIVHSQPLLGKRKNITGWIPSPSGIEPLIGIEKN